MTVFTDYRVPDSTQKSEAVGREPIAIIGVGCRFPGNANNSAEFWRLLCDGIDPITEVPASRWKIESFYDPDKSKAGKCNSRWGGFIERIDEFDADFFGISPREANRIDPQHRLLLEVSYEALEDSGQAPDDLMGSTAGVFVGISTCDYGGIQVCPTERRTADAYTNIGLGFCIAANRISHQFDFHGPSVAVDTACSSSLVATHLACQSIWNRECELAIVGGVNALLRPDGSIGFSKASMLAPDGRCKSFDARANGYVRSEGAGVIVIKRLSRALANGDQIYAVVRATFVNQDGRTPGLSLPNQTAQESMLRQAYHQAGVSPNEVHFIEAHGTGTPAGDPIELNAIGKVLGYSRMPGDECVVGSVKSNIGHLEAASGIAGLIKAALCIKYKAIPPNLHFQKPNPEVSLEDLRLRVPTSLEPWGAKPFFAGVNSFGFGGTNAHVILQSGPFISGSHSEEPTMSRPPVLLISARTSQALNAFAKSYRSFLASQEHSEIPLRDICATAALRRGRGDHRLTIVGDSAPEIIEGLDAFVAGEARPRMASGRASKEIPKLAFVFPGMGQQWWRMGRELLERESVFRSVVAKCDEQLRTLSGLSVLKELGAPEESSRIDDTQVAQPAIFAIQLGLAALWSSWGVEPDVVVGHSVGEVAAAYLAGILSLKDAATIVIHRSRLQSRTAGHGKMLAVGLSTSDVKQLLTGRKNSVSIAAINSPQDVTLSGDARILSEIAATLEENQIFYRFLRVDVPYHSRQMDPLKLELLDALKTIRPGTAKVPFYSTALGTVVSGDKLNAEYWWRNVRNPVLFATALSRLIEAGFSLFLEVGAQPVLSGAIHKCFAEKKEKAIVIPSLRRAEPEAKTMLSSLAQLYISNYPVNWQLQFPQRSNLVRLPPYPWQRERYWHESEETAQDRLGLDVHPLLGRRLKSSHPTWTVDLDKVGLKYLGDHRIYGNAIFPASGYVEMALAASQQCFGLGPCVVEGLSFEKAMWLTETPHLQLVKDPDQPSFEICGRSNDVDQLWTRYARGNLRRLQENEIHKKAFVQEAYARCTFEFECGALYNEFQKLGLQYGPCFQGVKSLRCGEREAIGDIVLDPKLEAENTQYALHPALLDSCFQVLLGTLLFSNLGSSTRGLAYLPVRIDSLRYYGRVGSILRSYAQLVEHGQDHITGDIKLIDESGSITAEVRGFRCQSVEQYSGKLERDLYKYQWRLHSTSSHTSLRSGTLLAPPSKIAERLKGEGSRLSEELGLKGLLQATLVPLRTLTKAYIVSALQRLGCNFELNQTFSTDALIVALKIAPDHHRLFEAILEILREDGALLKIDTGWKVLQIPERENQIALWRRLWNQAPALQAELLLLRQCGERLADVLKGDVDPLELLFPKGSTGNVEQLYQDAPSYQTYNILVQKVVTAALTNLPSGKALRVLEIGAGTGGLTAYVLRKFPADRTEYVLTDVSPLLTSNSEQKFHDFPFVQYRPLDIETDPATQGYQPHSFDLILASDALHATKDLRESLNHVKQLLAPNGLLVLLELTNAPQWVLLVFGLLKGWWRFNDAGIRQRHPWITSAQWQALLISLGFTDVATISDTENPEQALHSVLVAQGPAIEQTGEVSALIPLDPLKQVGAWLIFDDNNGIGSALAERLKALGNRSILVSPGDKFARRDSDHFEVNPHLLEDMKQLVATVLGESFQCNGVVHLWSVISDRTVENESLPPSDSTIANGSINVLLLVQVLAKLSATLIPRLWLVTKRTQAVGDYGGSLGVAQTPLWGLHRTITNEFPTLRSKIIDLDDGGPEEINALFKELLSEDDEDEVVLRGESRYIHRLTRTSIAKIQEFTQLVEPVGQSQAFSVEIPTPGMIDHLTFRQMDRRQPGPGEVEIRVYATALNFKDVMLAMGLLPSEALEGGYTGRTLGMECAGVISALGMGVTEFGIGDEVIASGPGALASHLIIAASSVFKKPPELTCEEAATIPIAFLTAYYALHFVGHVAKRERVLIHSAAGGVGLAALQLALQAGAEVYATAGTALKRDLLRSLGVHQVLDSRSLSFADEIMEFTKGEGVDIVINSLSGDAIAKSLSVLRRYGRFVEIGKRDIYENRTLELRPFRNNLSYFAVDLDKLFAEKGDLIRSLMTELIEKFTDGTLRPLSHRIFPIVDLANAFRYMAQGRHIGKVVVSLRNCDVGSAPRARNPVAFSANATYLITGGQGGFGLATARWLVDHGARHLVLLNRRPPSREVEPEIEALRKSGAEVMVTQADVTSESEVRFVFEKIAGCMPPLRGIIHAAMVLDDALLYQLDEERMRRVIDPKVTGAWNMHVLSLGVPLDFFVMFSSFSSILGTPRQANYAAANAFLDGLAHFRRAKGLPALTVNWGVVSDVGYVARSADLGEKLDRFGFKSLPVRQMLDTLGTLLQEPEVVQIGMGRVDWQQMANAHLIGGSPRFSYLVNPVLTEDVGASGAWLIDAVIAAEPAERQKILQSYIQEQLAKILGTSPSKIDVDRPLLNLGIDSLTGVEIGNRVQSELGISIPSIGMMASLSVSKMVDYLISQLSNRGQSLATPEGRGFEQHATGNADTDDHAVTSGSGAGVKEDAGERLGIVENLSDMQVDTLLQEILEPEPAVTGRSRTSDNSRGTE